MMTPPEVSFEFISYLVSIIFFAGGMFFSIKNSNEKSKAMEIDMKDMRKDIHDMQMNITRYDEKMNQVHEKISEILKVVSKPV